jgi:hypothetical protein
MLRTADGDEGTHDFIESRRIALNFFLLVLLNWEATRQHPLFLEFLGVTRTCTVFAGDGSQFGFQLYPRHCHWPGVQGVDLHHFASANAVGNIGAAGVTAIGDVGRTASQTAQTALLTVGGVISAAGQELLSSLEDVEARTHELFHEQHCRLSVEDGADDSERRRRRRRHQQWLQQWEHQQQQYTQKVEAALEALLAHLDPGFQQIDWQEDARVELNLKWQAMRCSWHDFLLLEYGYRHWFDRAVTPMGRRTDTAASTGILLQAHWLTAFLLKSLEEQKLTLQRAQDLAARFGGSLGVGSIRLLCAAREKKEGEKRGRAAGGAEDPDAEQRQERLSGGYLPPSKFVATFIKSDTQGSEWRLELIDDLNLGAGSDYGRIRIAADGKDEHGNTYYLLDPAWTTNRQATLLDSNWSRPSEAEGNVYYEAIVGSATGTLISQQQEREQVRKE